MAKKKPTTEPNMPKTERFHVDGHARSMTAVEEAAYRV
jgi:hypothetical protein